MGRKIRTTVPIFHELLTPKWPDLVKLQEHEAQSKLQQEKYFNTRYRAMPLKQMPQGTEVHISNYPENGVVKASTETPRQYEVETPTGIIKRNRVQLVPQLPLPEKLSRKLS
jgi:hypothetical protein